MAGGGAAQAVPPQNPARGPRGGRLAPGLPKVGGTCPDARPNPARPQGSEQSGRPRPPRFRPVSRRVSRGGGRSGRGTQLATSEAGSRQAELSCLGPRAQGSLRSCLLPPREARASPRLWGTAAAASLSPQPTPLWSGARADADAAARPRAPPAARPAHRAPARGRALWPRARALSSACWCPRGASRRPARIATLTLKLGVA